MNFPGLCTGNSARSILLESIFITQGQGRVRACSAGSNPTGQVHPHSIALLDEMGHDTSGAQSKSWDEFAAEDAPQMDVVITVCCSAAEETCPVWRVRRGACIGVSKTLPRPLWRRETVPFVRPMRFCASGPKSCWTYRLRPWNRVS